MLHKVLLVFILLLAFYMAFIPHIGYAYPLHVDEWMHMAHAGTISQTGSITFPDPFDGLKDIKLGDNLWVGYHILWAMFQQVSGIDWISLFRYFPSIIFMCTVLAVYVLAARQGYGLEAAFFTCFIPTTSGLLGPAFMVPMAMAMLFIPLGMFLAFNIRRWPSYLLIFLFTCFLVLSHAAFALMLCIVLAPHILLSLRDNKLHSSCVLAALALPFILSLPWTFGVVKQTAGQLLVPQYLSPYLGLPDLLWKYGLLPLLFSLIGTIILIAKGGKRELGLVLGLALLLAIMLVFIRFHYGLSAIYQRGLVVMLLILSILAGAGLFWLLKSAVFKVAASVSCVFLVLAVLIIALPARLNASYYHMIDDEDYQAFKWIRDNIGAGYERAVVDPWKATAFSAITGKKAIHRIWVNQEPVDDKIYKFLESGGKDESFLRDNRASFVYNRAPAQNGDLIEIRDHVYVTNPNLSHSFTPKDSLKNAGFEAVDGRPPAFWGQWSKNCQPDFLYPEAGRNGGSCIAIKMSSAAPFNPWPQATWLQDVPVQAGRSYMIGGWIKTDNIQGQNGAGIMPSWRGPGNTLIAGPMFMPYIKGTNDWTFYQGAVVAPPGAISCTFCCTMAGCSGTAWYDDLLFEEVK